MGGGCCRQNNTTAAKSPPAGRRPPIGSQRTRIRPTNCCARRWRRTAASWRRRSSSVPTTGRCSGTYANATGLTRRQWRSGIQSCRSGCIGEAIRYLLHGNLDKDVLRHLIEPSRRPSWLRNYERRARASRWIGRGSMGAAKVLLGSLFPDRFAPVPPPESTVVEDDEFFERLVTWWDNDAERTSVIGVYEKTAWPSWLRVGDVAGSLREGSADHWLAFAGAGGLPALRAYHGRPAPIGFWNSPGTTAGGMCSALPTKRSAG